MSLKQKTKTYHKSESIFQVDLPDPSVSFEELLHVPLPGMRAEAADEHTTPAHVALTGGETTPLQYWFSPI